MTSSNPAGPLLVPELDVSDLAASLGFYVGILGFAVVFERPAERFAYLSREGVSLMLEEAAGPGRRFHTTPLTRPFGRGMNLQTAVTDVDALLDRVRSGRCEIVVPLEERWYAVNVQVAAGRWTTTGPIEAGNRQFVVADPDGYLWRFFTDLGTRPACRPTDGSDRGDRE